jgi:hypothetical protein
MKHRQPSGLLIVALSVVMSACELASSATAPDEMTCAAWLEAPGSARLTLADSLVGHSPELLEAIRVRQHRPPGTERDALVRDVEGSLTKNCEFWLPRTRTVGEVMDALY